MYTEHTPKYTDSFLLMLKAMMLFGKVTDFGARMNLRNKTTPPNPHQLPGFDELDRLVAQDFLQCLPPAYKSSFAQTEGAYVPGAFDTDL